MGTILTSLGGMGAWGLNDDMMTQQNKAAAMDYPSSPPSHDMNSWADPGFWIGGGTMN